MFSRIVLGLCTAVGLSLPAGVVRADDAAEIRKLREQLDLLGKRLDEREAQLARLRQEVEVAKREAAANGVKAKALQDRCDRLMREIERLTVLADPQRSQESARTVRLLLVGGAGVAPTAAKPPMMQGNVVAVEASLVEIDIGADAGLQKGNVLEVYRLLPADPKASAYLGRLTIVLVHPKQAVGRFVSTSSARDKTPRAGDSVSTVVGDNR